MSEYRVKWEIDIEADSPEEAARIALMIQRDQESEALFFEVKKLEEYREYPYTDWEKFDLRSWVDKND